MFNVDDLCETHGNKYYYYRVKKIFSDNKCDIVAVHKGTMIESTSFINYDMEHMKVIRPAKQALPEVTIGSKWDFRDDSWFAGTIIAFTGNGRPVIENHLFDTDSYDLGMFHQKFIPHIEQPVVAQPLILYLNIQKRDNKLSVSQIHKTEAEALATSKNNIYPNYIKTLELSDET
jgi:hypothetical protein